MSHGGGAEAGVRVAIRHASSHIGDNGRLDGVVGGMLGAYIRVWSRCFSLEHLRLVGLYSDQSCLRVKTRDIRAPSVAPRRDAASMIRGWAVLNEEERAAVFKLECFAGIAAAKILMAGCECR